MSGDSLGWVAFADLFRLFSSLREQRVVEQYAVVGAIGALFYAEATPTFDLDVAVVVPQPPGSALFTLDPLYRALSARGFEPAGPHVLIHGVPVQFLPGDRGLWREVVESARALDYDGVPVRVATPEHLVAMAFDAPEGRRMERAQALLRAPGFDRHTLAAILLRHGIPDRFADAG
jgi:hypothetical protein